MVLFASVLSPTIHPFDTHRRLRVLLDHHETLRSIACGPRASEIRGAAAARAADVVGEDTEAGVLDLRFDGRRGELEEDAKSVVPSEEPVRGSSGFGSAGRGENGVGEVREGGAAF